jgi:hypothetical protein
MVWQTIEKELPVSKKALVRTIWPYAWKVAAAILIFASAWILNDYFDQRKSSGNRFTKVESVANPELNELSDAEAFYTTKISNKQAELAVYAKQHPEIIEDLKKEFREMDKNKEELKKDLAESNADEKVIEAIIQSYRVKLEILDQLLAELRKSNENSKEQKPVEISL